jgi:hypothetical protein
MILVLIWTVAKDKQVAHDHDHILVGPHLLFLFFGFRLAIFHIF